MKNNIDMEFIDNINEYNLATNILSNHIDLAKKIQTNPFKTDFNLFNAFDFDFIFDDAFIIGLKKFLKEIGDIGCYFYVTQPNPKTYFFKHFQKFSIFEMPSDFSNEEFDDIVTRNPGDSPSDSLVNNSQEIAIFSTSGKWCILANREIEMAIIGFNEANLQDDFLKCFNNSYNNMQILTIKDYSDFLCEFLELNEHQKMLYHNLITNYSQ